MAKTACRSRRVRQFAGARDDLDNSLLNLIEALQRLERRGAVSEAAADELFDRVGDVMDEAQMARRQKIARATIARELERVN